MWCRGKGRDYINALPIVYERMKKDIDDIEVKEIEKTNNPQFKTAEVITLVLITCVVSLIMGILISKPTPNSVQLADDEIQNFLKEYNYIVDNYYGEVDQKELLDVALKSVIDALGDPYSTSIDEETSQDFNAKLNGKYEGLGISIANDQDNNIIITAVFENGPASKVGLKPFDMIVKLNGKELKNVATTDFINMVSELGDQTFKLHISRDGQEIEVSLKKEVVVLQSVSSKLFEKNNKKIGYIDVSIFANNTDTQFHAELDKLEQQNIDALIIDLRGNSGGYLVAVENMISMFLDKTKIIYRIEDKNTTTKHYSTGNITKEYKIALLTDGSSASASEMMVAALKESYGATIIGTKTFGKGTVQEMQNGHDIQYKLTTKKWLTPKGNWINGIGIKPDIEAKLSIEFLQNPIDENDNPLQKALEFLCK